MKRKISVVALPCLCVDVFEGTDEMRPGGEALNFAAHAGEFEDVQVTLLGAVGTDKYADFLLKAANEKNVDTTHIRIESDLPTAHCKTYLTPDGDRYYKDDSWNGAIIDRFRANEEEMKLLTSSDVVFIHFRADCFEQIFEAKKKYGFRLAADFSTYRDFADMERYAPYIEYFMISGEEDLLPYFEDFSKKYDGLFNMSLAEKGSVTYSHGKCYRVSARPVDEIIDTTGCGDSYHAGFVCEHMLGGNIIQAMNKGSEIAAVTLGHFGGF